MKNIIPILIIIATIGLSYIYVFPQYRNIKTLWADGRSYDDVLTKSAELRQMRGELRERLGNFSSADLDRLSKMMPAGDDIVQLILDLDNLARRYNILMQNIKTSEDGDQTTGNRNTTSEPPSTPYKVISISFNFDGTYLNMLSFLRDIEDSLRIMDVASIKVKTNKDAPEIQNYEFLINTYWLR